MMSYVKETAINRPWYHGDEVWGSGRVLLSCDQISVFHPVSASVCELPQIFSVFALPSFSWTEWLDQAGVRISLLSKGEKARNRYFPSLRSVKQFLLRAYLAKKQKNSGAFQNGSFQSLLPEALGAFLPYLLVLSSWG